MWPLACRPSARPRVTTVVDASRTRAAKPATDGPPTETIREVQRSIPLADKYQDMNAQDLTRREMDRLAGLQEARHQEVAAYEAPSLPEISGVYLHLERGF